MAEAQVLVADIGGTNARFALASAPQAGVVSYEQELTLRCRDYVAADDAIRDYLNRVGISRIAAMSLAVAGRVIDGRVGATNSHWHLSSRDLRENFNVPAVALINDFEAIAYSLPSLGEQHSRLIGGGVLPKLQAERFSVAVIGPGTGLGVAGLVRHRGITNAIVTEGGHVGFAPETATQRTLLERLSERLGRVSDERLVSGQGIENIYWALAGHDVQAKPLTAPEIFTQALNKADSNAVEAVDLFCEIFGQVAGNLALLQGAFDGVYLAGGIAQRYGDLLARRRFRAGFENKGRYRELMRSIPAVLITHPSPGLLGAAVAADKLGLH